jgi:hypothetical protein
MRNKVDQTQNEMYSSNFAYQIYYDLHPLVK